jgi:aspartokinase
MIKILSTNNPNKAEITKQMLEENNINVVLLNKQDSSYNMFGPIELFVTENQKDNATAILKEIEDERNA